ncbi:hypothetical protein D3C85_1648920 [compost metagenome]
MSVGKYNPSYLVTVLCQIRDIRNYNINTEHIFFRELQSRIHDYNVSSILNDIHVFPDFSDSAQCENHQFIVVVFFGQMNLTLL